MGRGLVEPVDDIRDTNPASHPELLTVLSDDFVEHGFRFKHLIRRICTSNAYQRSGRRLAGNASDQTYYSHALSRPLLHFLNSDLLYRPVSADAATLTRLISDHQEDLAIIQSLYMRSLSRPLTASERGFWRDELRQARRAAEDGWGREPRRRFHEDVLHLDLARRGTESPGNVLSEARRV